MNIHFRSWAPVARSGCGAMSGLMQLFAYGAQDITLTGGSEGRHCFLCNSVCRLTNRMTWSSQDVASAIRAGHVTCLQKARYKLNWHTVDQGRLCEAAAETSINMLVHVHRDMRMAWDNRAAVAAANSNNEECLCYTIRNGAPLCKRVCVWIAEKGSAACVRELRRRLEWGDDDTSRLLVNCDARRVAAEAGNLEFLRFELTRSTRSHTLPNAETLLTCAAKSGKEECLRYVFLHCQLRAADASVLDMTRDRRIAVRICAAAAGEGKLGCLRFAYDAILAHASTTASADADVNSGNLENSICEAAARRGSIVCLEFARSRGSPLGASITEHAAASGCRECLEYVYVVCGAQWTDRTAIAAINICGKDDLLCWACKRGVPVALMMNTEIEKRGKNGAVSWVSYKHLKYSLANVLKWATDDVNKMARGLREDRARAALAYFLHYRSLPLNVPIDIRWRAFRRLRALRTLVSAVFRIRRTMLARVIGRIEDAWLAYRFAPIPGRAGYDAARTSYYYLQ